MSTTSKMSSSGGHVRPCSSKVSYKDRQGECQKPGKYPDADGIRWWCGLHNPNREAYKAVDLEQETVPVVDREVLIGINHSEADDEMIQVMVDVQKALVEISNMRDVGWPPNTPAEKYKIIMAHMADRALEVGKMLAEKILKFRS